MLDNGINAERERNIGRRHEERVRDRERDSITISQEPVLRGTSSLWSTNNTLGPAFVSLGRSGDVFIPSRVLASHLHTSGRVNFL